MSTPDFTVRGGGAGAEGATASYPGRGSDPLLDGDGVGGGSAEGRAASGPGSGLDEQAENRSAKPRIPKLSLLICSITVLQYTLKAPLRQQVLLAQTAGNFLARTRKL